MLRNEEEAEALSTEEETMNDYTTEEKCQRRSRIKKKQKYKINDG